MISEIFDPATAAIAIDTLPPLPKIKTKRERDRKRDKDQKRER